LQHETSTGSLHSLPGVRVRLRELKNRLGDLDGGRGGFDEEAWASLVVDVYRGYSASGLSWSGVVEELGLGVTSARGDRQRLVALLKACCAPSGCEMPAGAIAVVLGVARRTVCRDLREILAERARLAGPRVLPAEVFVRAVRSRLSDFEGAVSGVLDEATARRVVLEEQGAAARAARHEAAGLVAETMARLERAASDLVGLDAPYREGLS
jgi:hypothetical protein